MMRKHKNEVIEWMNEFSRDEDEVKKLSCAIYRNLFIVFNLIEMMLSSSTSSSWHGRTKYEPYPPTSESKPIQRNCKMSGGDEHCFSHTISINDRIVIYH